MEKINPKNKRRLLVLASTFPSTAASHEPRFIADLCQHLSRQYSITVLTQSRKGAKRKESDHQVRIQRYRYATKSLELLSENGGIAGSLKANPWLIAIIPFMLSSLVLHLIYLLRKEKPEIIHAHWIFPQAYCVCIAQKISFTKIPVVCTSHGGDLYGLKGRFFNAIKNWTISQVQELAVVSSAMKTHVEASFPAYKGLLHVLPMGVDLKDKFSKASKREYSPYSLLFVGRLVKKKGLKHLILCLKTLLESNSRYRLTIAGDGPERQALEKEAKKLGIDHAVNFLGGVESKKLPELYRSMHLSIFPFVQADDGDMEGLGLVMIEAMGCNCPVIAGDVPAIHDVITHGKTGLIGNPFNTDEFSKLIAYATANSEVLDKISNSAHEYVHKNFSWEACAEGYHQLFKKI